MNLIKHAALVALMVFSIILGTPSNSYANPFDSQIGESIVSPINALFDISIGDDFDDAVAAYQGAPYIDYWAVGKNLTTNGDRQIAIKMRPETTHENGYYRTNTLYITGSTQSNKVKRITYSMQFRSKIMGYDSVLSSLTKAAVKTYGEPKVEDKNNVVKKIWVNNGIQITISTYQMGYTDYKYGITVVREKI